MNCRKCRDQLSAYLDGELAVQQAERIRAHLDTCKACREELEFLKQTIGLVKELPHVPAPPKLRERVLAGLETPQAEDVPREGVSKWRTLWPAAAVLVIGLAIWAFYRPRTPSEPQTVAAKRSMGTRVDQEFSKVPGRHPAGGEGSAPRAQDAIAMRARPETGTPDASPPRKGARIHQAAEVAREGDPRTRVMAKAAFARTETIVIYSEEPPVAYAKALDIVVEKRWQRAPSERRDRSRMASYQHLEWPASITLSAPRGLTSQLSVSGAAAERAKCWFARTMGQTGFPSGISRRSKPLAPVGAPRKSSGRTLGMAVVAEGNERYEPNVPDDTNPPRGVSRTFRRPRCRHDRARQ